MGLGTSGRTPGGAGIIAIDMDTLRRIRRLIGIPGRKCLTAGHIVEGFFQFLEKNGNDKLISHDCLLTNMKNFMLFATENTENDNRNVNMDNPAVTQLFESVSIWDLQMEKQARHRMV